MANIAKISFGIKADRSGIRIYNFKLNGIEYRFDYRYDSVTEAMQAIHDFVDYMEDKEQL